MHAHSHTQRCPYSHVHTHTHPCSYTLTLIHADTRSPTIPSPSPPHTHTHNLPSSKRRPSRLLLCGPVLSGSLVRIISSPVYDNNFQSQQQRARIYSEKLTGAGARCASCQLLPLSPAWEVADFRSPPAMSSPLMMPVF